MKPAFHPLRVAGIEPLTDEALSITFEVPPELAAAYAFTQGQHLTLRTELDGAEIRRNYSVCSPAGSGVLRVAVKKLSGGVFSAWAHGKLQPGAVIDVMTPLGHFHTPLDPAQAKHYVAIAAGSGITPVLSLLATALEVEPGSTCTLIYGNRTTQSIMFLEELEDLKNRYLARLVLHLVFSQEQMDVALNSGRLTRDKLADFIGPLVDPAAIDHVFVCGPHGMNDEAEAALLTAGVAAERIHIERFGIPDAAALATPASPAVSPGGAAEARIVIVRDGISRELDYRGGHANILEAAAEAGLEVPFSCRSGVCCTCRAKLLEGEVWMERNFALEKQEVAAGFVLTCQSRPLTARVVLSFDER